MACLPMSPQTRPAAKPPDMSEIIQLPAKPAADHRHRTESGGDPPRQAELPDKAQPVILARVTVNHKIVLSHKVLGVFVMQQSLLKEQHRWEASLPPRWAGCPCSVPPATQHWNHPFCYFTPHSPSAPRGSKLLKAKGPASLAASPSSEQLLNGQYRTAEQMDTENLPEGCYRISITAPPVCQNLCGPDC